MKFYTICLPFLLLSHTPFAQNNKKPTSAQQLLICHEMIISGLHAAKAKALQYGYNFNDIYDCVVCDDLTKADLIKHRASVPSARGDLMSFARMYIREYNDPDKLTYIFNKIIDNPGKPTGALLDWVDFYSANPRLSEEEKKNFAAYEVTIRRFGGKRISEMTAAEKKKYRQNICQIP